MKYLNNKLFVALLASGVLASSAAYCTDWNALIKSAADTLNTANTQTSTTTKTTTSNKNTANVKTVQKQINALTNSINVSDKKTQAGFVALVGVLSSGDEANNIATQISEINNNAKLTTAEKSEKISKIMSDYSSNILKSKSALVSKLTTSTSSQKKTLINAIKNINSATSEYSNSLTQVKSILSTLAANPSLALNLGTAATTELAQDSVALNSKITATKNLYSAITTLCTASNINVK